MLERFIVVLGQVMTLFLMMGVGFGLGKLGKISSHGTTEFSTLLLYVVTPCIIIDSFQTSYDDVLLKTLGLGVLCQMGCYALYAVIVCFSSGRMSPICVSLSGLGPCSATRALWASP